MRGIKWCALEGAVNSFTRRDRSVSWYGYQSREILNTVQWRRSSIKYTLVDHEISNHTNLDDLPLLPLFGLILLYQNMVSRLFIHYHLHLLTAWPHWPSSW